MTLFQKKILLSSTFVLLMLFVSPFAFFVGKMEMNIQIEQKEGKEPYGGNKLWFHKEGIFSDIREDRITTKNGMINEDHNILNLGIFSIIDKKVICSQITNGDTTKIHVDVHSFFWGLGNNLIKENIINNFVEERIERQQEILATEALK